MADTAATSTRTVVESKASIARHPIHPMLIPFPIAFLVSALATDLTYMATGDEFWARLGIWLVGAGFITGILAAVFGLWDFATIKRARQHRAGWIHFLGNATVLILAGISLFLRAGDRVDAIVPIGVTLSIVWTAILGITGWYGGELSYRHGIGVDPTHD